MMEFKIRGSLKDTVKGHSHIFNIFSHMGEHITGL